MFVAAAEFGFLAQFFLFGFGVSDVALGHGSCVLLHSFGRQSEITALFGTSNSLCRACPRQPVHFRDLRSTERVGERWDTLDEQNKLFYHNAADQSYVSNIREISL